MTKRKRKHKIGKKRGFLFGPRPVEILIEYKGIDRAKDDRIREILGEHQTGSGATLIGSPVRDFGASVPRDELAAIVRKLRRLKGLTIKKLVTRWERL